MLENNATNLLAKKVAILGKTHLFYYLLSRKRVYIKQEIYTQ